MGLGRFSLGLRPFTYGVQVPEARGRSLWLDRRLSAPGVSVEPCLKVNKTFGGSLGNLLAPFPQTFSSGLFVYEQVDELMALCPCTVSRAFVTHLLVENFSGNLQVGEHAGVRGMPVWSARQGGRHASVVSVPE